MNNNHPSQRNGASEGCLSEANEPVKCCQPHKGFGLVLSLSDHNRPKVKVRTLQSLDELQIGVLLLWSGECAFGLFSCLVGTLTSPAARSLSSKHQAP